MTYTNWKARLEGGKVATFLQPGNDDEGYYRKPITEMVIGRNGKPNGQRRVIDWIPVAYFISDYDQKLVGVIGAGEGLRDMIADEVTDESLWSWVCRNPIDYEVYQAVAERGEPWPDMPAPSGPINLRDALNRSLTTDNAPPKEKTREDYQSEIEAACASAPKKVADKLEAEEALGVKNRIAELRLEADKVGKSIYQPLHAAYAKAQKAWSGMVTTAKAHEDMIDKAVRIWREQERQRVLAEEAKVAAAQAEEAERNARAADRAIASGEPEPEPEVMPVEMPEPEPEIKPVYGRVSTAKQELKTFVTITDEAAVAAHFRGKPELVAVLQKLAEHDVKLGLKVPGTTTRRGYA